MASNVLEPPDCANAPVVPDWRMLRDRLLTSEPFRRAAMRFAPGRWIARRRARALFDLAAGFVYSQVLQACVRLQLFEMLVEGPATVAALAARCAIDEAAMHRLLEAARSLRLAERRSEGCYGLGPLGAALVGNPGVAEMIDHHRLLYADLGDPVAWLRGEHRPGALAGYWAYGNADRPGRLAAEQVADYTALMAASQPMVAEQVLRAYDFSGHRRLLDVGGGSGVFLAAAADRHRGLELALFDLPAVVAQARVRLHGSAAGARIAFHAGSFTSDALPAGADVVTLIRVLHDHDDTHARLLLRAVRRALPVGGALVIAEAMRSPDTGGRMANVYLPMYLAAMGSGEVRTPARIAALLRDAGFARIALLPTDLPDQLQVIAAQACAGSP